MCGIWCCYHPDKECKCNPEILNKIKHRGPDQQDFIKNKEFCMGFTHLIINGLSRQPFRYKDIVLVCNGEIFNYKYLANKYQIEIKEGDSDCSILPELFSKTSIEEFCNVLDGEFAIIAINKSGIFAFRDSYGVRPLFVSEDSFASEAKALTGNVKQFPPGTFMHNGVYTKFQKFSNIVPDLEYSFITSTIRELLTESVNKRLISDKPIGSLLSGGLDSSLIVSLLSRKIANLNTFSIGLKDSEDLVNARIVSKFCKTIHHEIIISDQEYLSAIPYVIRDIESYDVTTVRASVGNWLLGKYVRENTDIKVLLNGDGSDELFGGYLYMNRAPSDEEFDKECKLLLENIHYFDGLRSDRCISSHGLEPRTPYLDKDLVDFVLSIPIKYRKTEVQKDILRVSFGGYLPNAILNRKKEAFSDGMSKNVPWKSIVNEEEHYRQIYNTFYSADLIPFKWMPKWSPETKDPSAKTLDSYKCPVEKL